MHESSVPNDRQCENVIPISKKKKKKSERIVSPTTISQQVLPVLFFKLWNLLLRIFIFHFNVKLLLNACRQGFC